MNKIRTIIGAGLVAGAIALGAAGTAVSHADVDHCGWGTVSDTQGGVTACVQTPIKTGEPDHGQDAKELAEAATHVAD